MMHSRCIGRERLDNAPPGRTTFLRMTTRLHFVPAALALPLLLAVAACDVRSSPPAESRLFASIDSIDSPAPAWSAEPNLAVDPDGDIYLSWLERLPDSSYALRVAERDGDRWEQPLTVTRARELFVNWADFPSVLAFDDDRLVAHWLQRSGPATYAYDVRVAQSTDGGRTWSAGVIPHRDGTQSEHGFVSLWPEPDGRLGIAWLDGRKYVRTDTGPKETMLMHATVGRDLRVDPDAPLDPRICDCCQTSVAVASDGPVIAYRDRTDEEIRDISVVRRVGQVWTEPARVHTDDWKIDACPVNGPAIDARARRVVVAWFTGAGDTARVQLAFSSDGGASFGPPVRVDDGRPAGRVDVALLADGPAIVSWVEHVGEQAEVRVRRFTEGAERGGAREPSLTIARSTAARASGFPRMVATSDDVYFAWTSPGPTRSDPTRVRIARARLAK